MVTPGQPAEKQIYQLKYTKNMCFFIVFCNFCIIKRNKYLH